MEGLKDTAVNKTSELKREVDSLDDFEHLGHDSSPLNEGKEITGDLLGLKSEVSATARDINDEIDKRVETVGTLVTDSFDPLKSDLLDQPLIPQKMDSNLLQMGDNFPDRREADAKLDKFLEEYKPTVQGLDKYGLHNIQSFMDSERGFAQEQPKTQSGSDLLDRYSDSEPDDDFKPSKYDNIPKKEELPESFGSTENFKAETFKDVDEIQPEIPKKDYPADPPKIYETVREKTSEPIVQKVPEPVKEKTPEPAKAKTPEPAKGKTTPEPVFKEKTPEPVIKKAPEPAIKKAPEPVKEKIPEPVKEKTPEPVKEKTPEPPKERTPEPVEEKSPEPLKKLPETKIEEKKSKIAPADAEAIFCKMGLVESLIYWRNPKKSGPVFGGVLVVLLALSYFSLISVVAYLSLIGLTGTIAFRIYRNIVQAVQKTGDGHPFKDILEMDISLSQDKVREISEVAVAHINAAVVELRRLFLVEDLVDSIKFGVLLWTLTYLGAWFNGMSLIIIAWVALFTLPKVYETNKKQIDANLELVRTKLAEISSKVKAAIPIGKKAEEKKEQ
ncbi:reticulon-1 isoform X2 [Anoplophora glabripennis]|uniref:reticulon-1 isoform X2 n=1 Tax=Anoplophora glabripennis TaxID=217634 RepID=UPI00087547DC|nr:reticulon-1 isoform X2 [Anoplophora glabripennis]